jgi:hypothetical protein
MSAASCLPTPTNQTTGPCQLTVAFPHQSTSPANCKLPSHTKQPALPAASCHSTPPNQTTSPASCHLPSHNSQPNNQPCQLPSAVPHQPTSHASCLPSPSSQTTSPASCQLPPRSNKPTRPAASCRPTNQPTNQPCQLPSHTNQPVNQPCQLPYQNNRPNNQPCHLPAAAPHQPTNQTSNHQPADQPVSPFYSCGNYGYQFFCIIRFGAYILPESRCMHNPDCYLIGRTSQSPEYRKGLYV